MGKLQINGDLLLAAGDEDRFLTFNYTGGTGYDWRIGYLGSGSGNENFLVFQSDKEGSTFYNALKFGLTTLNAEFGGTVTASSFIGSLNGNASTATKLATARTISLTGSVTGSGSFDGSGNLSISTTTNHSHSYLPLSGGNLTGHIYLTKAVSDSSTANTSQIIFGTSSNNHLALSSNTHALILNPHSGSTTNQIILSLDAMSTFPKGINAGGKVELWSDSEGGNIRITSPNGSLWSIDALENSKLRFIWAEAQVPFSFSNDGTISGAYFTGTASYANNCDTVDGWHASGFIRKYGWWTNGDTSHHADTTEDGIVFAYTGHGVPSYWGTLCTFGYGNGRDYNLQLHGTGNNQLFFRNRSSDFGQGSWQRVQVVTGWGSTNPNSAGIRGTNTGDVYYVY